MLCPFQPYRSHTLSSNDAPLAHKLTDLDLPRAAHGKNVMHFPVRARQSTRGSRRLHKGHTPFDDIGPARIPVVGLRQPFQDRQQTDYGTSGFSFGFALDGPQPFDEALLDLCKLPGVVERSRSLTEFIADVGTYTGPCR